MEIPLQLLHGAGQKFACCYASSVEYNAFKTHAVKPPLNFDQSASHADGHGKIDRHGVNVGIGSCCPNYGSVDLQSRLISGHQDDLLKAFTGKARGDVRSHARARAYDHEGTVI